MLSYYRSARQSDIINLSNPDRPQLTIRSRVWSPLKLYGIESRYVTVSETRRGC